MTTEVALPETRLNPATAPPPFATDASTGFDRLVLGAWLDDTVKRSTLGKNGSVVLRASPN
eukprot:5203563-Amphidinium_carterae.1